MLTVLKNNTHLGHIEKSILSYMTGYDLFGIKNMNKYFNII